MTSAQQVWELCRVALNDHDGSVAVFRAFIDESGIHDGSPVVTVAAYVARPRIWRDWTKQWNAAKKPIQVYHAADAANLGGEFRNWTKADMNALAAKLLPLIANAEISGVVAGVHMGAFNEAMERRPDLRKFIGTPYAACFHILVGKIIRLQNESRSTERVSFIHENNDFSNDALESFSWIKKNVNENGRFVSLQFGSKAEFTPLQDADILAYEGNKYLRDRATPVRRAWTALNANHGVTIGGFGTHNMSSLI